jgi:hypothetical protein
MKLRTPLVRWRFNNQMRRAGIAGGILVLRIGTGALIFLVHGWHKLFEASAYLRNGAASRLVDEIAAMGVPLPGVAAVVTSAIQLVCAPRCWRAHSPEPSRKISSRDAIRSWRCSTR